MRIPDADRTLSRSRVEAAFLWRKVFALALSVLGISGANAVPKASLPNQEITLQVASDGTAAFVADAATNTATAACIGDQTATLNWGNHTPGSDANGTNCVVRTNDTVQYRVDWNNNERPAKNVKIVITIPATLNPSGLGNVTWTPTNSKTIVPGCLAAGSSISADGKTLTCALGGKPEGSSGAIFPTLTVGGQRDGDKLVLNAKVLSDENPSGTTSNKTTVVVSAKPSWNWLKGTAILRDATVGGVAGKVFKYPIFLQPDVNAVKGGEPLKDSTPISFFDHAYDLTPGASFQGWVHGMTREPPRHTLVQA